MPSEKVLGSLGYVLFPISMAVQRWILWCGAFMWCATCGVEPTERRSPVSRSVVGRQKQRDIISAPSIIFFRYHPSGGGFRISGREL